jgi:hypothetical protein
MMPRYMQNAKGNIEISHCRVVRTIKLSRESKISVKIDFRLRGIIREALHGNECSFAYSNSRVYS